MTVADWSDVDGRCEVQVRAADWRLRFKGTRRASANRAVGNRDLNIHITNAQIWEARCSMFNESMVLFLVLF